MSSGAWILPVVIAAAVLIRLVAGKLNHARIREYITGQGGTVLGITWHPFGNGWFGEKDSVIYGVRYRDREGNIHDATCKTGMFSGVYFTNDNIISRARRSEPRQEATRHHSSIPEPSPENTPSPSAPATDAAALAFENRRLREENQQLRAELERLRKDRWN